MKYLRDIDISQLPEQMKTAILCLVEVPRFIKDHQLWKGYFSNIWIFAVSVLAAYLFSTAVFSNVKEMITHDKENEVIMKNAESDIEIAKLAELKASTSIDSLEQAYDSQIEELENEKKSRLSSLNRPLFSGFLKLILLLILEIVIFHFSVKTNNILRGETRSIELQDFLNAEIRMFAVMVRCAILGWAMWLILKIVLSIFGISALHASAYYLITAYFLGFAFFDNYMELHDIRIREGAGVIRSHIGGVLVIGLISSAFLLVPFVGPLFVPIICSIAATRYAHKYSLENHASLQLEKIP